MLTWIFNPAMNGQAAHLSARCDRGYLQMKTEVNSHGHYNVVHFDSNNQLVSISEAQPTLTAALEYAAENYDLTEDDSDDERFIGEEPELLTGEDMDGDHASALASAGMGTDEDYGMFDSGDDDF